MMDCRFPISKNSFPRRKRWTRSLCALVWGGILMMPFTIGHAQEIVLQEVLYDTAEIRRLTEQNAAQLSPSVLLLGSNNKTGTVTLKNPTNRELTVALELEFYQITTDSTGAFIPVLDTLLSARMPSLASWVKDLPEEVILAPNESKTIPIRIVIPSSLAVRPVSSDEFWIQIVATSPEIQPQLTAVARQVVSNESGVLTLMQQPARGNVTIPMTSRTTILYRRTKPVAGNRASPFKLGTFTSRVLIDGQAEVCAPLRVVTTRNIYGRAMLSVRTNAGRDTTFAVQRFDIPAGSESSLRPCFQGMLPIEFIRSTSITLTLDNERPDIPASVRSSFADIRAKVMLHPPSGSTSATSSTSSSTANTSASVAVNEVLAIRGSLQAQLRREAQIAAKEGKIAILEIGAAWCGPCRAFLRSLGDSLMIDALRDARVVRVDFDQWGHAFVNGPYTTPPALPIIFRINPDGSQGTMFDITRWQELANTHGTLDARAMAPPLKTFISEMKQADEKRATTPVPSP